MEDPNETPEAVRERLTASIEVQRQYLAEIKALRADLISARKSADRAGDWKRERDALKEEVEMYRALVKGWPKGRKLIKRLTAPYDEDY